MLISSLNEIDENYLGRTLSCTVEKYGSKSVTSNVALCNYSDLIEDSDNFKCYKILLIVSTEDEFMRLRCIDQSLKYFAQKSTYC